MNDLEALSVSALIAHTNADLTINKHHPGSGEYDAAVIAHVQPLVLVQVACLAGTTDCVDEVLDIIERYRDRTP